MKKDSLFRLLLAGILILGFVVRFYRFDGPVADWHSWRQSDTAAVSRNFAQNGIDVLHPRMDNISNVQSGIDNPNGYFFVEFPLYNAATAGLFNLMGILTIEEWGRLITIFSSTLTSLFLYLLVAKHSNKTIGLLSAMFYSFIPFSIYYGRTILADTTMIMTLFGGLYFFDRWIEEKLKVKSQKSKVQFKIQKLFFYFLALLFTSVAFLLKPYAIFFILPFICLAWQAYGLKLFLQWPLWFFAIGAIAPMVVWREWMTRFPEGIPVNAWLFNGDGIRFRPAFFRWIIYERLTVLISGYFGIIFVILGLLKLNKLKEWMFFVSIFLGSILYVSVIATGNVKHDYYQILVMPSVAIVCAIGSYFLYHWKLKKLPVGKVLFFICLLLSLSFGWHKVRDYFNINNRAIVSAGEAVDRSTPKDALVIANYEGDSSFLYQTKRKGWANFQESIPDLISKGADYLVLVNLKDKDYFAKDYKLIAETNEYLIFDLHKKP